MNEQTERLSSGEKKEYDVVVVGGGAAGLSGALTLSRARRSVLVVDAGEPRNTPAGHVHGYLGKEGTPPAELLETGRAEVASYGGETVRGEVVRAEPLPGGGFRVGFADGATVAARRLLVTTGLVDELPPVPGAREHWGRGVLHCPYCHGWEVRDEAVGVLGVGPLAVHQALLWRQWTPKVTLFQHTAPDFTDDDYQRLAARDIRLVRGEVAALEGREGEFEGVRLADGDFVACRAAVVPTRLAARSDLLEGLGLAPVEQEMAGHVVGTYIPSDAMGATSVPGVWVAGNVSDLSAQVIAAAAGGLRAGAAINADLIEEETRRAVAERPPGGQGR